MKKDTIAFVLSEIEKSLQNSDLKRQLYLIERKNKFLKLYYMITEQDKKEFTEVVKAEIEMYEELIKIYSEENLMLYKHLIDLHSEHIENLKMLIP